MNCVQVVDAAGKSTFIPRGAQILDVLPVDAPTRFPGDIEQVFQVRYRWAAPGLTTNEEHTVRLLGPISAILSMFNATDVLRATEVTPQDVEPGFAPIGTVLMYSTKPLYAQPRRKYPLRFFHKKIGDTDTDWESSQVLTVGHTNLREGGRPLHGRAVRVTGIQAEVFAASDELFEWLRTWFIVSFDFSQSPLMIGPLGRFWWSASPFAGVRQGFCGLGPVDGHHTQRDMSLSQPSNLFRYGPAGVELPGACTFAVIGESPSAAPPQPGDAALRLTLIGDHGNITEIG